MNMKCDFTKLCMLSSFDLILGNLEFCLYILSSILIQWPSYMVYRHIPKGVFGEDSLLHHKALGMSKIALASSHDTMKSRCRLVSVFFPAFFCFFEPLFPFKIHLFSVFLESCFPLGTITDILKNIIFILFCFSKYKK